MDQEVLKVFSEYTKNWDWDAFRKGKVLISFSAIPGAGKTTVAKQLAERFNLARINKDEIHDVMVRLSQAHNEDLLKEVVQMIVNRLSSLGKVILQDSSVDRKYDQMAAWAEKAEYKFIVIHIEATKETLQERIQARNKEGASEYLKELPRWWDEHQTFITMHKPDFLIQEDNFDADVQGLIQSLNSSLSLSSDSAESR
ncbi:MAG: AAA family ATPase [Candidatus Doudnabacteria bacterium]|nr:AAA family ATPase [Candidatus Doudnabacteria bacterium]